MANLTVAIDGELLRRARQRALEHGTSVNALVRAYLEMYAGDEEMAQRRRILEVADDIAADLHYSERTWTRDDLYERESLR